MRITIDGAGRIVVPKAFRQRLGLDAGRELRLDELDGALLITPVMAPPRVTETPSGPVIIASDGKFSETVTDEMVRDLLEAGRV